MSVRPSRRWLPAALAVVLVAGIFTPIAILGQSSTSSQSSQLSAMITAAESARSYAYGTVNYAAANGLSVSAAQAQLTQGDSLLATAQGYAQSGTNLAAAIQDVQVAMSDYAGAAASSGLAMSNAGLTAYVDYYAAVSAVAEVNATVNVAASVAAQACTSAGTGTSGAQAFAQACAQVSAQIALAREHLSQAASILVQSSGHVGATVDLSSVISLVAQARTEVEASQSELLTIASYTYSQRGQAYVASVVRPLSSSANATIRNEASVIANLTSFQTIWTTYSQSQASAVGAVSSSASTLATAIAQVNTNALTSSVSAAQSTESQLVTELNALLTLPAVTALPGVVADINSAIAAATSYNNALVSLNNWAGSFSQAQISNYGAFIGTWNGDSSSAQTAGGNYLKSYQQVAGDLSNNPALQALSQAQVVLSLPVSQTEGAANTSIQTTTSAMDIVQTDINSFTTAFLSAQAAVPVPSGTLSTASSVFTKGTGYLNATAAGAMAQASTSVQETASVAGSFVASAQASLQATVGAYASSAASLGASGASLGSQTQTSTTATVTAISYVQSDSRVRTAEAAAGQADVSQALQLFASQSIAAGVAAMANACLEFQAASSASVSA